jgi:hypothetical protein
MSGVILFDRHASTGTILKQVVLMPIALMLILILALLAPFDYGAHLRKLARKRARLKDEIRRLNVRSVPLEASERTLRTLWSHCELDRAPHVSTNLDLLCQWIDVLYGSGSSVELKIREREREIGRRMSEANRPYNEDVQGAIHYYFGPPIDALIEELSEELPLFPKP